MMFCLSFLNYDLGVRSRKLPRAIAHDKLLDRLDSFKFREDRQDMLMKVASSGKESFLQCTAQWLAFLQIREPSIGLLEW